MRMLWVLVAAVLGIVSAQGQYQMGNWIYRNADDTTQVTCWEDSLTWMRVPPGSMGGMMGMMYDSLFARIDLMDLDSLDHPHDSTFIGWYRMFMGGDSMSFGLMHDGDGHMGHLSMHADSALWCQVHWDSLRADSLHRGWHPVGLVGWNGSSWVNIPSSIVGESTLQATTTNWYAATGVIGVPSQVVSVAPEPVPLEFALYQNFPNPFNPVTTFTYVLRLSAFVRLGVFNLLGEQVAQLVSGEQAPGMHRVSWDGSQMPSGAYFYRLQAGDRVQTRAMVLAK